MLLVLNNQALENNSVSSCSSLNMASLQNEEIHLQRMKKKVSTCSQHVHQLDSNLDKHCTAETIDTKKPENEYSRTSMARPPLDP